MVHELFRLLSEHLPSRVHIGMLLNTCTARGGEVSRVARRTGRRLMSERHTATMKRFAYAAPDFRAGTVPRPATHNQGHTPYQVFAKAGDHG